MTPFTGPDFNEGLNKFTPPEKPALTSAETADHRYACFHPIKLAAGAGA